MVGPALVAGALALVFGGLLVLSAEVRGAQACESSFALRDESVRRVVSENALRVRNGAENHGITA